MAVLPLLIWSVAVAGGQYLPAGPQAQAPKPVRAQSAAEALERSLPRLQEASVSFIKSSGCVSCHHNTLTVMTLAMARSATVRVDEDLAFQQQELTGAYVKRWGVPPPADAPRDAPTIANILLSLSIDGFPQDAATDAMAALLSKQQADDGAWRVPARRFVSEAEDIALTATSMRALKVYAPRRDRAAYDLAIQRASAWLAKVVPDNTEGRAFQLLGLAWSGAAPDRLKQAARALSDTQSSDGSWSALPNTPGDAHATGQALFALLETETLAPADPINERGAAFLLGSQLADGTWFVKARPPLPPHIDTGYPIGRDEVASLAATNWAAMALALGLR
jgi:hypothetical protein